MGVYKLWGKIYKCCKTNYIIYYFVIYNRLILQDFEMIDKRIFYLWCGSSKPIDVEVCVLSWCQNLPDYEIVEIKEDDTTWFDFNKACAENEFFNFVYKNKIWAYVADYIRFYVLEKFGGIWLDTDVQVLKSFNDVINTGILLGRENNNHIETALIGAEAHHPLIKQALDFYNEEIWRSPLYTSPRILTHCLEKFGFSAGQEGLISLKDITIYPPEYFYPFPLRTLFNPDMLTANSYALHWWKSSWNNPAVLNWLKNKHQIGKEKALQAKLQPYLLLYLFGFIPFGKFFTAVKQMKICGVPIVKIKFKNNKAKALLFGIIPMLKWK